MKGIDKTSEFCREKLDELTIPVRNQDDIRAVASISAGNNSEIGDMIAEAIEKVGPDGVLSIENGTVWTPSSRLKRVWKSTAAISPQFVNNNERLTVEYEGCRVLITDEKIEQVQMSAPSWRN